MSDKPEAKDPKDAPKDAAKEGDASAADAPKKKGRGKLFIILGVVIMLLGGGGAGAFFMLRKPADPAAAANGKHEEVKEANGIVNFEPFVVNLADPGGRRFLRINVRLVVPEEEEAKHIEENKVIQTRLRAAILELLAEQTSDHISTTEGKTALKKEISERAHHILKETEVADVLFSDFVIQY
jgi:flagellar FliL protein